MREWPGLPAAELAGPSTILKEFLRTEGRGSAWSIRLLWTSLYMAANRPVTGDEVETMAAISPLGTRVGGDIIVFLCVCRDCYGAWNLSHCRRFGDWGVMSNIRVWLTRGNMVFLGVSDPPPWNVVAVGSDWWEYF